MRTALIASLALLLQLSPAIPAENFVPLGYGYTPERQKPPPPNSREQRRIERADVYESELHWQQRQRAIDRNFMVRPMGSDWSKDPFTPNY